MAFMTASEAWTKTLAERADAAYDAKCTALYTDYDAKRDALNANHYKQLRTMADTYEASRAALDAEYKKGA